MTGDLFAQPEISSRRGVRASAGSGKTYELTTWYLRHLLRGTPPRAMLATTFTRKAAGEILARVVTRLCEACENQEKFATLVRDLQQDDLTTEQVERFLLQFCRSLHQVRISTIDSFFGQMLRGYCHDSGVAPDVRMADKDAPEVERIRLEAIRSLLSSHDRQKMLDLLLDLAGGESRRAVVSSLLKSLKDAHEKFEAAPLHAWEPEYSLAESKSRDEIEALADHLMTLAQAFPAFAATIEKDLPRAQSADWEGFLNNGISKKLVAGETTFSRKPIPDEIVEPYQTLIEQARIALLSKHKAKTLALRDALALYHEKYTELLCRERIVLFSAVPRLLSTLFLQQDAMEVAHRLDAELECLLLDEFQDTSPDQYGILAPFARQIAALPPDKGLLFCVGDVKQSIYGWRGGTPKLFDRLEKEFSLSSESKDISRRSSPVVLGAVNDLFVGIGNNAAIPARWRGVAQSWQQAFREHAPHHADLSGYVEVVQTSAGDDEEVEAEQRRSSQVDAHYAFAAERIKQIHLSAPACSVGVLLRSNEAAAEMLHLLHEKEVPATSESGESIAVDPAVAIVVSMLHFCEHPSDTAALCHLLNSPLRDEIEINGALAIASGLAAWKIRRELLQAGYAATLGRWAQKLAPHCDLKSTLRLSQLLELADAERAQPVQNAAEFIKRIQALSVEGGDVAPVRVMTIHKAKGLEFDIVVLPELHKDILKLTPNLLYTRDETTQEINRICVWPNETLRRLEPQLDQMYRAYRSEQVSEALCTLYVAMTRAKRALHLVVPPPKINKVGEWSFSFASLIHAGLCEGASPDEDGVLCVRGDAHWSHGLEPKEKPTAKPAKSAMREYFQLDTAEFLPRITERITPSRQVDLRHSAHELLRIEESEAAKRGTVFHALLARVHWLDEFETSDEELVEIAQRAVRGMTFEDAQKMVAEFRSSMNVLSEYFALPKLPESQIAECWQERRFAIMLDGALVTGTFDRVVIMRDANQRAVRAELFDFKTGRDDEATAEYYRPQIKLYCKALAAMLGLNADKIDARLVFVDTAKCVEIA